MKEQIPTLPIAGWELKTVPGLDALLISFSYLPHSMQTKAVMDRTYAIHTAQAEELAQQILAALALMKSGAPHGPGTPKH